MSWIKFCYLDDFVIIMCHLHKGNNYKRRNKKRGKLSVWGKKEKKKNKRMKQENRRAAAGEGKQKKENDKRRIRKRSRREVRVSN